MFKRLILESSTEWTAYASFGVMALCFFCAIWMAVKLKRSDSNHLSELPLQEDTYKQIEK